jgi:rubrerythrin
MRKPKTVYELRGRECGDGWNSIVQPLQDEVQRLGGTVRQIKEKFGGLRFYCSLPKKISENKRHAFRRRVEQAEEASFRVCETCGAPGELVNHKGYLFTACPACLERKRQLNP